LGVTRVLTVTKATLRDVAEGSGFAIISSASRPILLPSGGATTGLSSTTGPAGVQ